MNRSYFIRVKYRNPAFVRIILISILLTNSVVFSSYKSNTTGDFTAVELIDARNISLNGFIGEALSESESGRLMTLPGWNNGELIDMFREKSRLNNKKTNWYGEHAGKWLYSTSLAVARTGDPALKELLIRTADSLVSWQQENGYLGTYSPDQQLTNIKVSHHHSWDVWNLSYMTLGLMKVNEFFPSEKYSRAFLKIGELFLKTFDDGQFPVTEYGTRLGISATIILDPVVELYKYTRDKKYLDFAELIIREIEEKEGLRIISAGLSNTDMLWVGEGKVYQIIWNLTAITKLYQITGNEKYLVAVKNAWENIYSQHLTINGGPWGGVGKFYESFNRGRFWNPYGFIETCSIMAWIQLNKELFITTGNAKYLNEIEKSVYNALIGAHYPDGENWCYHSFTNGRRHIAHFNDCCPSSGALGLEEIPRLVFSKWENGISINLFESCKGQIPIQNNRVSITQLTNYPFNGKVDIKVTPDKTSFFPVFVRIPDWADSVVVALNGNKFENCKILDNGFLRMERKWEKNDQVSLQFPMKLRISYNLEHALKPQGGADIYEITWFALSRGPLNFAANGLIGGENREKVFPLPDKDPLSVFKEIYTPEGFMGPAFDLEIPGRESLLFLPYYVAGGREEGTWRLTWIQKNIKN